MVFRFGDLRVLGFPFSPYLLLPSGLQPFFKNFIGLTKIFFCIHKTALEICTDWGKMMCKTS
jgi:hypothetical protein